MARGKNARSVALRKTEEAASAEARARAAEIKQRHLEGVIRDKDQEISNLSSALIEARHVHTIKGTYSDSDIIIMKATLAVKHSDQVMAGLDYLFSHFDMKPDSDQYVTKVTRMAEAFGVSAERLMDRVLELETGEALLTRRQLRPKKSAAQVQEETTQAMRAELLLSKKAGS